MEIIVLEILSLWSVDVEVIWDEVVRFTFGMKIEFGKY